MWVEQRLPWGWFITPRVGELVEIEVTVGSTTDESFEETSIENLNPVWKGVRYITDSKESDDLPSPTPVPKPVTQLLPYPLAGGFYTPTGHFFVFSDSEEFYQVAMGELDPENPSDEDNQATIAVTGRNEEKTISLQINGKGQVVMAADGQITIENSGDADIQIKAPGKTVTVESNTAEVNAETVNLANGADTPAVRGDDWETWAKNHTHPSGMGPTGIPIQPIVGVKSTKVNLK